MSQTAGRDTTSSRSYLRWIVVSILVLLSLLVLGTFLVVRSALNLGDPVTGITEVKVSDFDFSPPVLQVRSGTTVTWNWDAKIEHNVAGDGLTSPMRVDGSYEYTFQTTGTYEYHCTRHSFMRGSVIVTD